MNFSFVAPNVLAGTRTPWREAEVRFLRDQGITTLIRLQEPERLLYSNEAIEQLGVEVFHYSIPDGGAPSVRGTQEIIEFLQEALAQGKVVAVSCGAGVGRTGTILACYLVAQGMTAEQAIPALRGIRSPSIETVSQVTAVYDYEQFLLSQAATALGNMRPRPVDVGAYAPPVRALGAEATDASGALARED